MPTPAQIVSSAEAHLALCQAYATGGTPVPPDPPPTGGLPAWLPPVGQVKAISLNTLANVTYGTAAGPGSGTTNDYFGYWTSGCYALNDGQYGSMVFCGGGDANYWGNEVYKFSLDTRTWSRECERSTGLIGGSGNPGGYDDTWGEHTTSTPRQPGVPHTYDQVEYLPPAAGGGQKGSFMFGSRTVVYRYRQSKHPHVFDLATKAWRRASASPNIIQWEGTEPPTANSWCFDSRRNRYVGVQGGGGSATNANRLHLLTFGSNGLASYSAMGIPQFTTPFGYMTTRYWSAGDLLLVIGIRDSVWSGSVIKAINLATGASATLNTTGDALPPAGQGYGLAYCDDLNCFAIRRADGDRQAIWRLSPPASNPMNNAWSVQRIVMAGQAVAAKGNSQGMWKRFMYSQQLKSLLWVDDVNGPVYAYRVA